MAARILVFRDSITYGAWDLQGGWADQLKRNLHQRVIPDPNSSDHKFALLNLGVSGDTSRDILARAEAEITARYSADWPFAFVLAVGINDSRADDGVTVVEESQYLKNLQAIIRILRQYSDQILIVGLTPVTPDQLVFKNSVYRQAAIKSYNTAAKQFATEQGLPFVDVFDTALRQPAYMDSLDDGLHPGESGHEFLYQAIQPKLLKLIGATSVAA
jgi:lysophospholipase L1-like esterase